MEAMVTDSLTMEQFHAICRWDLARYQVKGSPTPATVRLGAILVTSGHGLDYLDAVVPSSNITINLPRWETIQDWGYTRTPGARGEVTEDGWTRYSYSIQSADLFT